MVYTTAKELINGQLDRDLKEIIERVKSMVLEY
jgi:hypothetical protein